MMGKILRKLAPLFDIFASPMVLVSSLIMLLVRRTNIQRMPISKRIFLRVGIFPIRDHYHEPLFNPAHLKNSLREDRDLKGIDWNIDAQLELLEKFNFNNELERFPVDKKNDLEFFYNNVAFASGDAEYLYNIIRYFKPKRIIEIGSGYSTMMTITAIRKNKQEDTSYSCEHVCIEPYENLWLEKLEVKVVRELVENVDKGLFSRLGKNDILFIDSSHMIRPQGDVLYEYLEILPLLNSGVLIQIHDIFTPKDYLNEWLFDEVRFWNEQYLLEGFLSFNKEFKIIGALNYLRHHHPDELSARCPIFKNQLERREPGSFWIVRV